MLTHAAILFLLPFVASNPVPAYSSSDLNIATPVGPASQTSSFPTAVTPSITLPGGSSTPKPTITGVPRSTSSIVSTFTPITSTVYTGPICELLPYGPPNPFFATGAGVTGLKLSFSGGAATLDAAGFGPAWTFGTDQAVGAWYPEPCGYVYLDTIDSGFSFKYLYWSKIGTSNWNAVNGTYLTGVNADSTAELIPSSNFLACHAVGSKTWFLFLQLGNDIPTENVFGVKIVEGSCVSTKLQVKSTWTGPVVASA